MPNAIRIPATLAAVVAASALSAPLARAVEPSGACPSSEAAVQSEVEQLHVGMRMRAVFDVLGSRGAREPESDTAEFIVRQWVYCGDGYESRQAVMFAPASRGWVVYEIG